jgi:6-pyruvoyltetrahydropterin/6-carboxytetrahydropterin synthase
VSRAATLELHKDEFSFSAGHFTVFSATEREDLHGHNYNVSLVMGVAIDNNGMAFDYRVYKKILLALCEKLDRRFLLANNSVYLKLEETPDMWLAHFNNERIPFLKRDVVVLPLTNITIEELSFWFLQALTTEPLQLQKNGISHITVRVYNGPGQSAAASWKI